MNAIVTPNVLRHVFAQAGVMVAFAAADALLKVDWSQLGMYAPLANAAAAVIVSVAHAAFGKDASK